MLFDAAAPDPAPNLSAASVGRILSDYELCEVASAQVGLTSPRCVTSSKRVQTSTKQADTTPIAWVDTTRSLGTTTPRICSTPYCIWSNPHMVGGTRRGFWSNPFQHMVQSAASLVGPGPNLVKTARNRSCQNLFNTTPSVVESRPDLVEATKHWPMEIGTITTARKDGPGYNNPGPPTAQGAEKDRERSREEGTTVRNVAQQHESSTELAPTKRGEEGR